ncbi:MAG: hypothetical protein WAU86_08805, partial [Oricola sp.]
TLLTTSSDGVGVALAQGELLLVLPLDDPGYLSDADAICVTGFVIRGDEGGTWTGFETLRIAARKGG